MLVSLILACFDAVAQDQTTSPIQAAAVLEARSGSQMTGLVTFIQNAAAPDSGTPGTGTPGTEPGMGQPGMGQPGTGDAGSPGTDQPALGEGRMPREGFGEGGMQPGMGGGIAGRGEPIQVSIRLVNAAPGNHAVFLHENGDCSAPDASSAGNFYADTAPGAGPGAMPGRPGAFPGASSGDRPGSIGMPASPAAPEAPATGSETPSAGGGTPSAGGGTEGLAGPPPGYLGFVTVGADGRGEEDLVLGTYTLGEGTGSLVDRAVVVYERAPDFTAGADPGARQACGVIRKRPSGAIGTE
jgi:Cu/Zn superoxide dismutase